jgi:hypothetical protein
VSVSIRRRTKYEVVRQCLPQLANLTPPYFVHPFVIHS